MNAYNFYWGTDKMYNVFFLERFMVRSRYFFAFHRYFPFKATNSF